MKVLVVSPHPDDETLGCGGTLFKHLSNGDELYWAIITNVTAEDGWDNDYVKKRGKEIKLISKTYHFKSVKMFNYSAAKLDEMPMSKIVQSLSLLYKKVKPEIIYMPFCGDVHTDHQIIAKALQSTLKWFRHPYIKKVLMYETLSETEINFIDNRKFSPNVFVNISKFIDNKIDAMNLYESEIGSFPFPRSEETIKALAKVRGSQSGYHFAESFELVYELLK